jgi:hypothetical protein
MNKQQFLDYYDELVIKAHKSGVDVQILIEQEPEYILRSNLLSHHENVIKKIETYDPRKSQNETGR